MQPLVPRRRVQVVALVVLTIGCAAHERSGDAAAQRGDWREALSEFDSALQSDNDSLPLQRKYEQARREVVAAALRRGQGCSASGNWSCTLEESELVLRLDPTNDDGRALRAEGARGLKRKWMELARVEAANGQLDSAFGDLQRANEASWDPDLERELEAAKRALIETATERSNRLLAAGRYAEAIRELEGVLMYDATKLPILDGARAALERQRADAAAAFAQHEVRRRWAESAYPSVRDLWMAKCSMCHDRDGTGQTKTGRKEKIRDMSTDAWQAQMTDEKIRAVIRHGVDGTKMRAFEKRLSVDEINQLIKLIRAFGGAAVSENL